MCCLGSESFGVLSSYATIMLVSDMIVSILGPHWVPESSRLLWCESLSSVFWRVLFLPSPVFYKPWQHNSTLDCADDSLHWSPRQTHATPRIILCQAQLLGVGWFVVQVRRCWRKLARSTRSEDFRGADECDSELSRMCTSEILCWPGLYGRPSNLSCESLRGAWVGGRRNVEQGGDFCWLVQ